MGNDQVDKKKDGDSKSESTPPAAPYEGLALYVAKSFKGALPVVVIVCLIAYGAYYGIDKINGLQKEALDAEKAKNEALLLQQKAQDEATYAAEQAKNEALQQYSKQLSDLNKVTADVSSQMQALVSSQIDNMAKDDKRQHEQQERERQLQSDAEKALNDQLVTLRKQADEAQKTAALSVYNYVKTTVTKQLSNGNSVDYNLFDIVEDQLDAPLALSTAKTDADDPSQRWELRVGIYTQLFKKTSDPEYFKKVSALLQQNSRSVTPAIIIYFTRYNAFNAQQTLIVLPVLGQMAIDNRFSEAVRSQGLQVFSYRTPAEVASAIDPSLSGQLAAYAGGQLLEASQSSARCYELPGLLGALRSFSVDQERSYATQALQKLNYNGEAEKLPCKNALDQSISSH